MEFVAGFAIGYLLRDILIGESNEPFVSLEELRKKWREMPPSTWDIRYGMEEDPCQRRA